MAIRFGPQVEAELDEIWIYIGKDSGSVDVADRLVDSITDHYLSALEASSVRSTPRP